MQKIANPKTLSVYGEVIVNDWICQKCLAKFYAGDFSLNNALQSEKPVEADGKQMKILFEQ